MKKIYKKIDKEFKIQVLTAPTEQTLLVPVKDPISGNDFYSGEVLVTSTIVQVEGTKGWSMVMDSNDKLSLYVSVIDACYEAGILKDEIKELLKKMLKSKKKSENKKNKSKSKLYKSFF